MSEVTRILDSIQQGHPKAAEELLRLVYGRRVRRGLYGRAEGAGETPRRPQNHQNGQADLVKLLLVRGADANAEGGQAVDAFLGVPQTPLMLARKRGRTAIEETKQSPQPPSRALPDRIDSAAVRPAVENVLPRLQKTAGDSRAAFLKHLTKQDCTSCHQQNLPMRAIGLARSRQVAMDAAAATQQIDLVLERSVPREYTLQAIFHPEPVHSYGYALFGALAESQPANTFTDSMVHHLAVIQGKDGRWFNNLPRPPIQSGDVARGRSEVLSLAPTPSEFRKCRCSVSNANPCAVAPSKYERGWDRY